MIWEVHYYQQMEVHYYQQIAGLFDGENLQQHPEVLLLLHILIEAQHIYQVVFLTVSVKK